MLKNLYKIDTILAFSVSTLLYYYFNRNLQESLKFSVLFVVIFLFLLDLID